MLKQYCHRFNNKIHIKHRLQWSGLLILFSALGSMRDETLLLVSARKINQQTSYRIFFQCELKFLNTQCQIFVNSVLFVGWKRLLKVTAVILLLKSEDPKKARHAKYVRVHI